MRRVVFSSASKGLGWRALHGLAVAVALIFSSASVAQEAAKQMVWQLRDIKGYLFVEGKVDGKAGLFMFDSGTPFRVLLNRHYVPLGEGKHVVDGSVGSGQPLVLEMHGADHRIAIDGYNFLAGSGAQIKIATPDEALSGDFSYIEQNITSDYLGMVGWGLLKDYYILLDYQKSTVTLYPVGKGGSLAPSLGTGQKVVIPFSPTSMGMEAMKPLELDVGGMSFPTVIDTGGGDEIQAPAEVWAKLESANIVKPAAGEGEHCVAVSNPRYREWPIVLPTIEKKVGQDTHIALAYRFLRNYRSLWNPVDRTVTLERAANVTNASERPCS